MCAVACHHASYALGLHSWVHVCMPVCMLRRYRPNFLEAVKFAWIQYVCMFWIVWWAVQLLRGFIFREQIVPTRVVWETKPKDD